MKKRKKKQDKKKEVIYEKYHIVGKYKDPKEVNKKKEVSE